MTLDGVDLSDGLFLRFVPRAALPGRSTPVIEVRNKATDDLEALIKWRCRRKFSLYSEPGKMFGTKCLHDVTRVIDSLNQAHKAGKELWRFTTGRKVSAFSTQTRSTTTANTTTKRTSNYAPDTGRVRQCQTA